MLLAISILLSILRLSCLMLLLYYLNKRWINKSKKNTFLQFLVHQWFTYGSLTGIIIFITVQLGIYSLLNCMFLLSIIVLMDILGSSNITHLENYSHAQVKRGLHNLLKGIELKKSITTWLEYKKKDTVQKNRLLTFFLLFVLLAITFISRTYFLKYDSYTLSTAWSSDLLKVSNFDKQNWFDGELIVSGDMAFANFYSKIFNISPEIALFSVGMLESIQIVILLFWATRFITFSTYLAPLVSALSFALFYTISPVNLNYILQPRSAFLALSFAIPSMVYILKPQLLMLKKVNFFVGFLFVFFTIGLIDLFVFCILLPPFLLLSVLLTKNRRDKRFLASLLAYFIAAIMVLGIYAAISFSFNKDFWLFLHSNMVSVDSYTYIPQLIMPLKKLLMIYLLGSISGILILIKFMIYNKEDWKASMAFLIYFAGLILSLSIKSHWLDPDLIIQSLTVFIPMAIGIIVAIFVRLFNPLILKFQKHKFYTTAALIVLFVYFSIYFQKNALENDADINSTNEEVLSVYSELLNNYFPYTYLVVNDYTTQVISENNHFFLNYSTFLDEYLELDYVYFKNIKNPGFLKKHPEYTVPKSVFLFVYDGKKSNFFTENNQYNPALMKLMQELKRRGRRVELFSQKENFKVYEIINEPDASKISDLIF